MSIDDFSADLKKGSMEMLILSLLEDRARHGYEIGKQIEARSGGRLRFALASVYPALLRLEGRGWIKGRWVERAGERSRCYYRLTAEGQKVLARQKQTWEGYIEAVNRVLGTDRA
jgi:transcriptional regulator